MKIASASLAMESHHQIATRHEQTESLRSWRGERRPDFEGTERSQRALPPPPPPQISAAAQSAQSSEAQAINDAREAVDQDPFLFLIRTMIEWLTGEPVRLFDVSQLHADGVAATPVKGPPQSQAPAAARPAGFGVEYDYHALHEEFERTDFSAQGVIKTADGLEIAFKLDLTMSRHFRDETTVSIRAGDAIRKDPLVINFDGQGAQLTSQRFRFDLDADGRADDLAMLAGGSGYLALDLNGNGRIDSGAELFGPASGSGFDELARHDDDANGWIDENDAVFGKLRVWTPAAQGAGTLSGLAKVGVGALHLGKVDTPFELRGSVNQDFGAVRDTGIYLLESGSVGVLQEIDLTV